MAFDDVRDGVLADAEVAGSNGSRITDMMFVSRCFSR